MNRTTYRNPLWSIATLILAVTVSDGMASQRPLQISNPEGLSQEEGVLNTSLVAEEVNSFPFEIRGSRFFKDERPVFVNIICYSPIEPGKSHDGKISEKRLKDDLRRFAEYEEATDQIALRIYPGPTEDQPNRIPDFFYEEVRKLGFWVIRDIYFEEDFCDPNYPVKGYAAIDSVIEEVNEANALDLIFAWELGNEFVPDPENPCCCRPDIIGPFLTDMCSYLKAKITALEREDVTNWVTWGSWPPYDPLHTDGDAWEPEPNGLDYFSYNAYSYWPEQIQDHQPGPVTGTPYQGYLSALKGCYPSKPLVVSEVGFSDSYRVIYESRCHPWYPSYRYGAMTPEQVAEGLVERYWDARLWPDDGDPNVVVAGLAVFEWNDEWWKHKGGNNAIQEDRAEEHFGLGRFDERAGKDGYQLRYKLEQEAVRDLYTLTFDNDVNIIESVVVDDNSISVDASTCVHVNLSDEAVEPVRLRWEASRGYVVGDPNAVYNANRLGEPNSVKFYSGNVALGPALISLVAIDANGNVDSGSIVIDINVPPEPNIALLTLGTGKASGCISNTDLQDYKLVVYIEVGGKMWVQPDTFMTSIWIRADGYWWTKVVNDHDGDLICWLVPKSYVATDLPAGSEPPEGTIATAKLSAANDQDNDLLADWWEIQYLGAIEPNDRYDDADGDGAQNIEEFLAGTSPIDANDNDLDGDDLWDNWERRFFGSCEFYDGNDDPDGDGLDNRKELSKGLSPLRAAVDRDEDGLPDLWEIRWFNNLAQRGTDNRDLDGCTNLDEYEVGLNPVFPDLPGDLDCDCEVNWPDLALFARQWLSPRLVADVAPDTPDRTVEFLDLKVFGGAWLSRSAPPSQGWLPQCDIYPDGKIDLYDFAVFAGQWLHYYYADIAPNEGDGVVNLLDFAILADNWLARL